MTDMRREKRITYEKGCRRIRWIVYDPDSGLACEFAIHEWDEDVVRQAPMLRDRTINGKPCSAMGFEVHSPKPMYGDKEPDHELCGTLMGPCWHDGSSLSASEFLARWGGSDEEAFREVEHWVMLRKQDMEEAQGVTDSLTFTIPFIPLSLKNKKGLTYGRFYKPPEVRAQQNSIRAHALDAAVDQGLRPTMAGSIFGDADVRREVVVDVDTATTTVTITWLRKKPKGMTGRRFDLDNVAASIDDALQGLVYDNDSQISECGSIRRVG